MDVCTDIEVLEGRLLPLLRPAPVPTPLGHTLEQCIDGEPRRRETLADRARRCLAADPYDPDAAHLLGLLGSPDDAPLLVPGALRGLAEGTAALARLGGPLADDVAAWDACVRGGWSNPLLRRGPTATPAEVERLDRARLEERATRPWTAEGREARGILYAAALNEWPVPERWVEWARQDLAHGSLDGQQVVARVDGRAVAEAAGARFDIPAGCCGSDDRQPDATDLAALLAAPRPAFPTPAVPATDAKAVRAHALPLLLREPAEGLYLLGFVAREADLARFDARLYGRHAVAATAALARWRTDDAVDLLIEAARGPDIRPAMSALAASRTERGWTAALASWKGRTALTQTGTVEGCEVGLRLVELEVDAYVDVPCLLRSPDLRRRAEVAAAGGSTGANQAARGSAWRSWAAWEPLYDPDPSVRAAHLDRLLRWDLPDVDEAARGIVKSPWAKAYVTARGRHELTQPPRRPPPEPLPDLDALVAEVVERRLLPDHRLRRALEVAPDREDEVFARFAAIADDRWRVLVLSEATADLPEARAVRRIEVAIALDDPEQLRIAAGALRRLRPAGLDPAPLVAWCTAPGTSDDDRLEAARALQVQGHPGVDSCVAAAIGAAPVDGLVRWATHAADELRGEAAWAALALRFPGAPDDVRAALSTVFRRVGLTAEGTVPQDRVP